MRRFSLGVVAAAVLTGQLYASSISCSFNGGASTSSCYGTGVSFASNDSLNFLSAFGSAQTSASNPDNVMTRGQLNAFTNNNLGVSVTLGGGGTTMPGGLVEPAAGTAYITRADNTQYVWASSVASWDGPGDPGITPSFIHYAGQFAAPTQEMGLNEGSGGWGAALLGPTASNGSAAAAPLVFTFNVPIAGVGFNISTVSASTSFTNTNFRAEIDAYNGNTFVGSYFLIANGLGGYCSSLLNFQLDPTACNDAPFIGFATGTNSITKITIDAIDSTGNFGFFLANMVIQEDFPSGIQTPEPAVLVLTGGGLALLGLWERKRRKSRG